MVIEKYFGISRESVLQMIDATKNIKYEKSGDNGFQQTKVFLFDDYAVLKMKNINVRNVDIQDTDLKHLERLAVTLLDLQSRGINVVPILAFRSDNGNGYIVQERAKGAELYERDKMNEKEYILNRVEFLSNVQQTHFNKFVLDSIKIIDAGVLIDFMGKDNFFYSELTGFQFIDLNAHFDYKYGIADVKPQGEIITAWNGFLPCYYDTIPKYKNTVSKILPELTNEEFNLLSKRNRVIFNKCRAALLNAGIAQKVICEIITNERFIQQKQLLKLIP